MKEKIHPDYHKITVVMTDGSSFETRRTAGPWTAGGEFVAAHTAESVNEILKEVKSLRDEGRHAGADGLGRIGRTFQHGIDIDQTFGPGMAIGELHVGWA